jgi:hypothetical protein
VILDHRTQHAPRNRFAFEAQSAEDALIHGFEPDDCRVPEARGWVCRGCRELNEAEVGPVNADQECIGCGLPRSYRGRARRVVA